MQITQERVLSHSHLILHPDESLAKPDSSSSFKKKSYLG